MKAIVYCSNSMDLDEQVHFLNGHHLRFDHLDWVQSKSWLGSGFSYTLVQNDEIVAMLSCANENPQTAWIRYFVCSRQVHYPTAFNELIQVALHDLKSVGLLSLHALASQEWVQRLLENEGFSFHDEIMTLFLDINEDSIPQGMNSLENQAFTFRPIEDNDLAALYTIDQKAFPPAWQLGMENLEQCAKNSNQKYLAFDLDKAVAYLMSESIFGNQHLSRIAVDPNYQGQHLASALIQKMLAEGYAQGVRRFSVNTNRANHASLALYKRFGYALSEQTVPVYAFQI